MIRLRPSVFAALLLTIGCTPAFKYSPGPPIADLPAINADLFFQGFEDKTAEPPPANCPASCCDTYNLAKIGSKCMMMSHLEPHVLGHALMQELSGSGMFGPVSYLYPGELPEGEGIFVRAVLHRVLLKSTRQTRLAPTLDVQFTLDVSEMPGERPVFTERYGTNCKLTMAGGAFNPFAPSIQSCFGELYGRAARDIAQRLPRR